MTRFHDILALFLFPLIYLLPLFTVSTARPSGEPPSGFFSILQPAQLQSVWTPRNHGRNTRAASSRIRASLSEKRTPPGFTSPVTIQMRMMAFTTTGLIAPIASAARALEDFYSSIAINAAGPWQAEPRSESFSIQQGNFRLAFRSTGDAIPWDFVKTMAERLWESACLGMSNLFEATYMDDAGQVIVSIALRLAEDGSSSSGTYYREGSVESVTSP